MPGLVLPAIVGTSAINGSADANLATVRAYLKGQVDAAGIAAAGVRRESLPRPAVFGAPVHAAYGETQDVFGVEQAKLEPGLLIDRPQGRQDINGSLLDPQNRARLHKLCWSGRVPRHCRLLVNASWSVAMWRDAGAAALVSIYGGKFVIRLQEPGQASVAIAGSEREAGFLNENGNSQTPYHSMAWLTPSAANASGRMRVWVEYDRDGSEFLTTADPAKVHMVIGNANMVVRCFKDYTS